jgi:hypothetical protein
MYWVIYGLITGNVFGVDASFLPIFVESFFKQHRELSLVISQTTFCVDPKYYIDNGNQFYMLSFATVCVCQVFTVWHIGMWPHITQMKVYWHVTRAPTTLKIPQTTWSPPSIIPIYHHHYSTRNMTKRKWDVTSPSTTTSSIYQSISQAQQFATSRQNWSVSWLSIPSIPIIWYNITSWKRLLDLFWTNN